MKGTPETTPVKVLLFRAAYNLPVTLGIARGVFIRHGLDLDIAYTRGSRMVVEGLRMGEYDLGVLSADDVVYEVEAHDADLFMVMGLHGGILTLVGRPGIRMLRDVVGKRLGVDDPASGFALVAHHILRSAGVARADYQTVPVGGHEHRARALLEGVVDVALLTPPFTVQARARGCTTLARAHEHLPAYQASAGVTTRRWARAHEPALVAYIRAYRESLDWALAPENRCESTAHLGQDFQLSPEDARATYAALIDPVDGLFRDARIDAAGVRTVIELRVDAGQLAPGPRSLDRYLDARYLARARSASVS
jgi:ABC-type nitrate/sulfonate/bicarbonate transport system substrate-binding protein